MWDESQFKSISHTGSGIEKVGVEQIVEPVDQIKISFEEGKNVYLYKEEGNIFLGQHIPLQVLLIMTESAMPNF